MCANPSIEFSNGPDTLLDAEVMAILEKGNYDYNLLRSPTKTGWEIQIYGRNRCCLCNDLQISTTLVRLGEICVVLYSEVFYYPNDYREKNIATADLPMQIAVVKYPPSLATNPIQIRISSP
jgi:hypothetical protein